MGVVATPILNGAVLRIVDQPQLDSLVGINVGVKTCASRGPPVGRDAQGNPNS